MITFKIPEQSLRHFLIAWDMNWQLRKPDYIFHVENGFEVVYMGPEIKHRGLTDSIDKFVEHLWKNYPDSFLKSSAKEICTAIEKDLGHIPVK